MPSPGGRVLLETVVFEVIELWRVPSSSARALTASALVPITIAWIRMFLRFRARRTDEGAQPAGT